MSIKISTVSAVIALGALVSIPAVQAQVTYHVVTNTSSLSGQTGFLDFQFAKGNAFDSLDATAILTDISTDSSLNSTSSLSGATTGILPAIVTISNTGSYNDLFQGLTFGQDFTFNVTFTGDATNSSLPSSYGSTFAYSLFASDSTTPLLTTDPNGTALDIAVNPGSVFTVTVFPASATTGPAVSATDLSPIPELSSFCSLGVMFVLGTVGLYRASRRRRISHD